MSSEGGPEPEQYRLDALPHGVTKKTPFLKLASKPLVGQNVKNDTFE